MLFLSACFLSYSYFCYLLYNKFFSLYVFAYLGNGLDTGQTDSWFELKVTETYLI
jgi:hypothetical protein